MTAQFVPSSPSPFYQTADMEPDMGDFIDIVEEPKLKPKKSSPVEPSYEMWKLRKAGIASDQKSSWKTASKDKSPFASDAVAKKLQKLLKQKNSGVQTYQGLSSVKQLLIDYLVDDKNVAESHPYAEWTCEHIDTSDEKSKVDEKRAIYAYLQRRDTRGSPTTKKEPKPSQRPDNIIDVSDRLRRTTMEDISSSSKPAKAPKAPKLHVNVDKTADLQRNQTQEWKQHDYVQFPPVQDMSSTQPVSSPSGRPILTPYGWRQHDYFQVPQAQGYSPLSAQPAPYDQPTTQPIQPLATPPAQPIPSFGQPFPSPAGWTYPPYVRFPPEPVLNAAEPQAHPRVDAWQYDSRPSPIGMPSDDTGIYARAPLDTQEPGNPFAQGYFTQGQKIDPKQIRTEAPRPVETDNIPSVGGGTNPINETPRHEPGVSPSVNQWQGRFDPEPKWDPNRPLDWAQRERQQMRHPYPATDTSDEVWSNATSGKQSTAPTSVSQGSYGRASFENSSPPAQYGHRSPQNNRYYHPGSYGSSGYHCDRRPAVQEPAKTQHRQSQKPDARYYEQRRDRRAASPRLHQNHAPRSPSHSPPRHRDDHRRGRSPSFSPEWRSGDYHARNRPRRDYSPIPMNRAERRGGVNRRRSTESPNDRQRDRERYDRRPTYEQSPSPPRRARAERDYDPHTKRDHDPRTERDYDRRPQRDRSPDHPSQGTRRVEPPSQPAEMIEKLARAIRRTEEDDERKRQEEKEKEFYAKVREEVLADMYSQRAAPGPNNPGPNGGFRQ